MSKKPEKEKNLYIPERKKDYEYYCKYTIAEKYQK